MEEKMYEIHNADGLFSCRCDVCVGHIKPQKRAISKGNFEALAALPPTNTLKKQPDRIIKAL